MRIPEQNSRSYHWKATFAELVLQACRCNFLSSQGFGRLSFIRYVSGWNLCRSARFNKEYHRIHQVHLRGLHGNAEMSGMRVLMVSLCRADH